MINVDGVSVRIHAVPSGMTDADRADMDRQIRDQVAEAKRLGIRRMFWLCVLAPSHSCP